MAVTNNIVTLKPCLPTSLFPISPLSGLGLGSGIGIGLGLKFGEVGNGEMGNGEVTCHPLKHHKNSFYFLSHFLISAT